MSPTQTGPLADVHAYLKGKDKDFTADLATFEKDMQDDEVRQQVYDYLKGQDKEFTASFDEFSQDLGVKKKSGGSDSSTGSLPGQTSPANGLADIDPEQIAPGTQPGDSSFGLPEAGALGYQLPGVPLPAAEQALAPQLESQVPFAPGTQANPSYLGAPSTYAPDQVEPIEQRGPMPLPSTGDSPRSEQELLDSIPALKVGDVDHGGEFPASLLPYITKTDMDENDIVQVPPNYSGGTPAGTFTDKATGLRYFTRPLSNKVAGKEQTRAQAFGTSFVNASTEILQGAAEGLQAVANLGALPYQAAVGDEMAPAITTGTEASEALEATKGQLAPIYTAPGRQNVNTVTAQAGSFAPMVLAQVAQTLAPETRLPGLLKAAVGLAGTVSFDAPLIHGARERAKAAGFTGAKADLYTVFESALTLGAFKLGGKLINQAGDAAVLKAAPKEFGEAVALDATQRVAQLEAQLGRAATQAEQSAALSTSLKAALPKLVQFAKGTVQQGVTLPLAGTVTTAANQVGARALGGKPEEVTMRSFWEDRKRDAIMGIVMGGVTEGVGAGLDAAGALIRQPAGAAEQPPAEADETEYYVTGDDSNTDEAAIAQARVVGPGTTPDTVLVEGTDFDGQPVQREVARVRLLPKESTEQPLAAEPTEAAPSEPSELTAPEQVVAATAPTAPTPEPTSPATGAGESAQAAASAPSIAEPEPSPAEPATAAASAPDAVGGEPIATEPEPTPAEPLPAAEPDPTQVKVLTPQQQATNDTLDALDRYNALKPGQKKGKEGSTARAEIARAAKKAKIDVQVGKDGTVTLAGGKRLTRSNEYTATTPAANHVPLDARPEDAHAFMEAMLFTGDAANVKELQGLGVKMRGKELSARELGDAVKDIRAGRNTMRAQLVLDTLENAHRQGFVEKSTGTGLATQKFRVPIDEYLGNADESPTGEPRDLTDDELDAIYESDPKAKQAVDDYAFSDGTIDYNRLANDERGLSFMFDVSDETATKLATIARERAQQQTSTQPRDEAAIYPNAGGASQSNARIDEPAPASEPSVGTVERSGDAETGAGAGSGSPQIAPTLAEQNRAAKAEFAEGLAAFRAARKKNSGVLQSSVLGLPAFSAEEAAALTKMAKAAIKLGAVKTKQVIARLRAQGLTDDDVTDDQLRPFVKQLLADEGVRQPKAPKERPQQPTDPSNTEQRQGARSIADSGLSDELSQGLADRGTDRYTPKSLAETKAHVDRIITSEGIDKAYYTATHAGTNIPKDVHEVLRIAVMAHYDAEVRRLREDPDANGAAIDEAVERAGRVADVYVAGGTEDGRALRARQTLQEYAPSVAVARLGREVKETADAKRKSMEPAGRARAKAVRQEKATALDAALASPAVQAKFGVSPEPAPTRTAKTVVDPPGWGSKNKYFTKESAQKAREALRKLGLSTVIPPELIHFLGFHIEAGARSFADVSARAVRDLGQKVRPLLPEAYEQAKKEFILRGGDNTGFDGPDAVEAALRGELAEDLAERIVSAARPARPGVFDPVRDLLDTLTKKVREKLPARDKTPRAARELLALAMQNRAEYADVFEQSKALVDAKIDGLRMTDAQKQKMRDDLQAYHAEIIGQPYADQQFARAFQQAQDEALKNYGGKNRGQQLDAAATASDAAIARDRQAIIDHVTQGVTDAQVKQELASHVRQEFDQRLADRQRALRVKNNVGHVQPTVAEDEQAAGPAAPSTRQRPVLSDRVRDLLATRATDERVAARLAPDAVREGLAAEGQRLQQIARDHLNDPTDTGRTLAEAFVQDAGLSGKQAATFAAAIEQEFARQIQKAQDKAVQQAYSRKVRTSEPKAAQDLTDRIRKLYTLSPTDESRVLGLVADEANLPELTKADNTKLYMLAQAISEAKGDNAKARAVQNFYLGVKTIRGLTGWEQVKTVMYANMLSGLGTQLKNVNSTGLNTASDLFYATGWASFLAVRQAARTGDLSALKLAVAPIKGIFNRSGADRAYQMLTTGVRPPGYEGKFDEASDLEVMAQLPAKSRLGVARKAYANFAKYIPRLLGANDLMWSGGAEQMWAYNIALTDAVREGRNLPSDQIWASVNERLYGTTVRLADAQAQATQELGASSGGQYRMRVQELMEASRDQRIAAESKRAAAETTFNGPMEGFIGDVMSKLGRLTEAEAGRGTQPLKGIVPFTRIVANVTNAFLNYTPVGAIRAGKGQIGWGDNAFARQYTPMERSVVFGKSLTGAIVMAAAYQLLDDDNLTGNGPSDPAQNRAWQQRGHKAYTIGGVNYKDSPWYYPLAAVAALKEAQSYDGADFENDPVFAKRAARMLVATTQASFASLSLTNLQDFLNALSDPSKGKDPAERMGRYMQRTVGAVASSVLVPGSGLLRGASRMGQQMAGSTKREATDVWGMMGQDVPFGVRDTLPRVYDVLGNEVSVGANVPFMPVPEIQDESGATKRINEFLDANKLFIPDINRYQSDMQVLKGRVGELSAAEKAKMSRMTDTERKKYLLGRLGGEGPMPADKWQEFYPKRGRLIKEKLLLHLPELEKLAKENPRRLRKKLNRYYRQATKQAKKGIDFSDPDMLPVQDE